MKVRRGFLSVTLVLMLLAGLIAGCVSVSADDFPVEGEYTLFGVKSDDTMGKAEDLGMESVLTLEEGGTGNMTMNDEAMPVSEWKESEGTVSITMEDGSAADGALINGVLELDLFGDGSVVLYYAAKGADTSAYEMMTLEEIQSQMGSDMTSQLSQPSADSKVGKLRDSLDKDAGIHLKYVCKPGYLDSVQNIDVCGKGGYFYSLKTTQVSGYESTTATYCGDGKVYTLSPDDMTAIFITESNSVLFKEYSILMDSLCSAIWTKGIETEFTEGTKEIEGVTYDTEVFPATEYVAEATFCFDADGKLAYYIEGAPVVETAMEIGEAEYKIEVIDNQVDESLFDISGYTITENPLATDDMESADAAESADGAESADAAASTDNAA